MKAEPDSKVRIKMSALREFQAYGVRNVQTV